MQVHKTLLQTFAVLERPRDKTPHLERLCSQSEIEHVQLIHAVHRITVNWDPGAAAAPKSDQSSRE